ncbi:MAG: hypothetical protein KDD69_10325 [Bdellovibrionales bacterium]|nr:hypothetical protein [Bdellovibrionales bacterium]
MEEAIRIALEVGCGSSLQKVRRSKRYKTVRRRIEDAARHFPADSDCGVAFRVGNPRMGILLNTLPEPKALEQARSLVPADPPDPDLLALTTCLGSHLVRAAGQCLPDEITELAARWQNSSADEQIQIVSQLYFALRSDSQESSGCLTVERVLEKAEQERRRRYDPDVRTPVLPRLYGKWDSADNPANCQGKTQMITAFGRLAGTRVLSVSPLTHSRSQLDESRRHLLHRARNELRRRDLDTVDPLFAESLQAAHLEGAISVESGFHVGAALELKDKRWVMLDPHGLVWGVVPDVLDLGAVYNMLKKYRHALPGLTMIRDDANHSTQVIQERLALAEDLISRSHAFEEQLDQAEADLPTLIRLFEASNDIDLLWGCSDGDPQALQDPAQRKVIAHLLILGPDEEGSLMPNIGRILDPLGYSRCRKSILSYYYAAALNLVLDQLNEAGQIIHPIAEYALPEFDLATSVLNDLHESADGRPRDEGFFIRNVFRQMTFARALHNPQHVIAASQVLCRLPFLHENFGLSCPNSF